MQDKEYSSLSTLNVKLVKIGKCILEAVVFEKGVLKNFTKFTGNTSAVVSF